MKSGHGTPAGRPLAAADFYFVLQVHDHSDISL
jgi:hypothetical protein